jgi:hypothetical protein
MIVIVSHYFACWLAKDLFTYYWLLPRVMARLRIVQGSCIVPDVLAG